MPPTVRRIALITPRLVEGDGQGRVNLELIRRVDPTLAHVTVITRQAAPELRAMPHISVIEMPVEKLPTALLRSQLFSLLAGRWIERRRSQFDLVHIDGSVTYVRSDINSAHFVHGAWGRSPAHTSRTQRNAYGLYHRISTLLHSRQERAAYARATRIVAVSSMVKTELISIGVPEEKIEVVSLGVDATAFHPGERHRTALGLPENGFIALFAGDMKVPRKNLDCVLRALVRLPDMHLAVVGSLSRNPYPELARRLGLENRVTFLGYRSDIANVMRACDAFAFPSRYEPFGLVVLEALASGLPVVTASTTGASDMVSTSCGTVVEDPDDDGAVASALRRLSTDKPLLETMSAGARAQALEHSWDFMAQRFFALYDEVGSKAEGISGGARETS